MVTSQNTPRPSAAARTASRTSLRSIGIPLEISVARPMPKNRRAARHIMTRRPRGLFRLFRQSALLDAIGLVAAATVLGQAAERGLEAVDIFHVRLRRLSLGRQLGKARLEARHVFPDLRRSRGLA